MKSRNILVKGLRLHVIGVGVVAALFGQSVERPVRAVSDPGVVTTRQAITPAGVSSIFQGRIYGVAFGNDSSEIWVLQAGNIYRMDWRQNQVAERIPLDGSPGLQGIRWDAAGKRLFVSSTGAQRNVRLLTPAAGRVRPVADGIGSVLAGSLAVAGRTAIVPLIYDGEVAVVDVVDGTLRGKVKTGIAPFGAVMDGEQTTAYVTNWGGRVPTPKDLTAPRGHAATADRVVVDDRGIASSGTVSRIDLREMRVTHTIAVELHPTAILWDEPRNRVYVANGNKDSVSVIDTRQNRVIRTIPIQPFPTPVSGIAPTALAVSRDGKRLFVACGGINAIAVVNTTETRIEGMIPTGWYPNGIDLSPDGKLIAVSSLLGAGSGWRDQPGHRYVHAYRGSVQVIEVPEEAQLASYTTATAENNRINLAVVKASPSRVPVAVPARAGDASLIEYVVYVIKENRTYDQIFGDLQKGNGDPSLLMFGEDVAPNHRRLADQFVLLDNFYATGGNSGDGHQWVTQANETAYCLWPGYTGRSYPYDGSDPIAYSNSGFIWDLALQKGKTVRVFGEYAGRMSGVSSSQRLTLLEQWKQGSDFSRQWSIKAPIEPLNRILATNYPSYTGAIPDVVRAQIFLGHLKQWEKDGKMPNLILLQLPSDHTYGTAPRLSTPRAMVADNDFALGQIVDGLTRSRFWKKMAIFVVEDDAQNGVDHVDGHRTVALAVSPYTRRGHVDSTFYSHQSILKTIELMLGLPTLSLFDLIANDMRASFHNTPDYTPYTAVEPAQSLFDANPPLQALRGEQRRAAIASAKMRWDVPDAAPTELLNRIVWKSVKGWSVPYPEVKRSLFAPLSVDVDDDER